MIIFFLAFISLKPMAKEADQPIIIPVHQQWHLHLPPLEHADDSMNCRLVAGFSGPTSQESSLIECDGAVIAKIKKLESILSDQQIAAANSPTKVGTGQGDKTHKLLVREGGVAATGGHSYYYLFADQIELFLKIKTYGGYSFAGPFRLVKKSND